jgi:hypothetical protein
MTWDLAKDIIEICVAVFGLFLAIQGVFVYFIVKWSEKVVERQKQESQKILANDYLINRMHELTSTALERLYSQTSVLSWALQRVIIAEGKFGQPSVTQKVLKGLREADSKLESALVELMTLSSNPTQRESAFRDIAERSGGVQTLITLRELQQQIHNNDPVLAECIKRLESRLCEEN